MPGWTFSSLPWVDSRERRRRPPLEPTQLQSLLPGEGPGVMMWQPGFVLRHSSRRRWREAPTEGTSSSSGRGAGGISAWKQLDCLPLMLSFGHHPGSIKTASGASSCCG